MRGAGAVEVWAKTAWSTQSGGLGAMNLEASKGASEPSLSVRSGERDRMGRGGEKIRTARRVGGRGKCEREGKLTRQCYADPAMKAGGGLRTRGELSERPAAAARIKLGPRVDDSDNAI